jgi:hypothetical protein
MYCKSKFEFKNHLKLFVYRQIYDDVKGCRIVTLDKEVMYLVAWKHELGGTKLIRELGAGSGEQGKRERGIGIVIRNPEIKKFHQK